ncbi:glutamine synthetase family protein [Williamsia phyllosphaerae]|uniref:Glutamine synthetase n=1 Tax=Williamsia phyllosphaerae TaxID=885042 RepID=A0ABQ1UPY7_9NOCA|nr:glutamine synthetase family protein [Williamsia phyllosphaerae]GGF23406.1 glutamine synthetase [Williamsia phyllosphaerae]
MAIIHSDVLGHLHSGGVEVLIGTVVNPAGLIHAKTVDVSRVAEFGRIGLGVSPVWHAFTIDKSGIAYSDKFGAVGDQRIRIDLDAIRILGDGVAWAPANFYDQDSEPVAACSRGTLGRIESRLAAMGITALVGHELEFVLVDPAGEALPTTMWAQYGLAGVLEHEGFVREVLTAARTAGIGLEQLHPEYGGNQFEVSLAPLAPVAAADQMVAARTVIGRVARRFDMRACFSPKPFADGVGNGAHQHLSLSGPDGPLLAGGSAARGMTAAGASAVAGVVAGLPDIQAVLCGSIVSGLRMQPGFWAGAYACWGTENREAAVRFVLGGPANPHGANVEVKIVDPSANAYLATAAILGMAADGIERELPLPPETLVDPASQTESDRTAAGTVLLPTDQAGVVDALDRSAAARAALGDDAVDAVVAVRRYEQTFSALPPGDIADTFRMAWSV